MIFGVSTPYFLSSSSRLKTSYFEPCIITFLLYKTNTSSATLFTNSKSFEAIINVLLMVGIDSNLIDDKISSLSLSDKRLLSLACALIYNPNLILMDNFTEELDDFNKNKVVKLIKMLKVRFNKTFIIASNDIEFVHKVADEVFVINDGKVILKGTKYDVFKKEEQLKKIGLSVPKIVKFENLTLKKKNIRLGFRDEINDLIKDIYRHSY